jgi:GNAT superfamily N-acetyltransferase
MIAVRRIEGEPDLAEWLRIRNQVDPHEAASADDIRDWIRRSGGERAMFLAEVDREPAGCGVATRSESMPTACSVAPRVLPAARRLGVGTALLRSGSAHARAIGCGELSSSIEGGDEAAAAFASHFGFVEVGRQVELVRPIAPGEARPVAPAGVDLSELRPEYVEGIRVVARQAGADMPLPQAADDDLVETWIDELVSGSVTPSPLPTVRSSASPALPTDLRADRAPRTT